MKTSHLVLQKDACNLACIESQSVQLVVTSPPYPMIEMWDTLFAAKNPAIAEALSLGEGNKAFELMHDELDKTWRELYRVLDDGCFLCINIGDATRTLGERFQLYSNHARILQACREVGFDTLPSILWRKPTNAPNKFMGSGMLPAGAYVTLEHEYILILRKGGKRIFASAEHKKQRNESAFFWEERNQWFSDIWDIKGVSQKMQTGLTRERSAAYPLELPYRLIQMYSLKGDTVLDPFLGTGTTTVAATASCRSSVGIEIDPCFLPSISESVLSCGQMANERLLARIEAHQQFAEEYQANRGELKYRSVRYGFPVMTQQEILLRLHAVRSVVQVSREPLQFLAEYDEIPGDGASFDSEGISSLRSKRAETQTALTFGDLSPAAYSAKSKGRR